MRFVEKKTEQLVDSTLRLICGEDVTRPRQLDQLCAEDPLRDKASVFHWHQSIPVTVDYQRGRGNLRKPVVAFPGENGGNLANRSAQRSMVRKQRGAILCNAL